MWDPEQQIQEGFLVFHSHMPEINEDPEQLPCRHEMRDVLVAVVWRRKVLKLQGSNVG